MRDFLPVLAVAALVILVGAGGYFALFDDVSEEAVTLQRVTGPVSVLSGGDTQQAEEGETLEPGDQLTAGAGGQAVLAFGEQSSIVLEAESTLKLRGRDDQGLQVELEGGRIRATVRPGDGRLAVNRGGQRVDATDARFEVGVDDEGVLQVRADEGELGLVGFGGREGLGPGERISLVPGGDPWVSDEDRALLLELDSVPDLIAQREQVLTGRTDPHARIRVEGGVQPVSGRADAEGIWRLTVPLKEGDNALLVVASDPLGQEREQTWQVAVDTRPPEAVDIQVGE